MHVTNKERALSYTKALKWVTNEFLWIAARVVIEGIKGLIACLSFIH